MGLRHMGGFLHRTSFFRLVKEINGVEIDLNEAIICIHGLFPISVHIQHD